MLRRVVRIFSIIGCDDYTNFTRSVAYCSVYHYASPPYN